MRDRAPHRPAPAGSPRCPKASLGEKFAQIVPKSETLTVSRLQNTVIGSQKSICEAEGACILFIYCALEAPSLTQRRPRKRSLRDRRKYFPLLARMRFGQFSQGAVRLPYRSRH